MSALAELSFAFKRYWRVVIAATVVGALVGLLASAVLSGGRSEQVTVTSRIVVLTPETAKKIEQRRDSAGLYSASGAVLVEIDSPADSRQTSAAYTSLRIPTYMGILDSDATRAAVAESVGLGVEALQDRITVTRRADANIIEIQIQAEDPSLADEMIRQYVSALADRIEEAETGQFALELLTVSTASPQTSAESTITSTAELQSLLSEDGNLPLTEPFDPLRAEVLEAELRSDATFSELHEGLGPNVVTIEPGVLSEDLENSVVDPESGDGRVDAWVLEFSSDDEAEALALMDSATDFVERELTEVFSSGLVDLSPVIVEGPFVIAEPSPVVEGRGPTDAIVVNLALGSLLGAVLGILYALARVNIAPVIRSPHQISRLTGRAPYRVRRLPVRSRGDRDAVEYDDYVPLATSLLSEFPQGCRLLVSPVSNDEEPTEVAQRLAQALRQIRGSACIVDFTQRRSREPRVFVPSRDEPSGSFLDRDPVLESQLENLVTNEASLSPPDDFASQFAYVIVVCDPLDSSMDALLLAQESSGVLLTMRYGSTRLRDTAGAVALLDQASVKLLATVVLDVPDSEGLEWLAHSVGEPTS